MGVLSTILLSAGVLRHYYDIHVYHSVRGISFLFVGIDAAGDVFSLTSICKRNCFFAFVSSSALYVHEYLLMLVTVFQEHLDILGIVIYTTEFVLWCGVFACGGYFNLLPWLKIRYGKENEVQDRDITRAVRHGKREVQVEEGISHDIELNELHSVEARTVFRTSGSVISLDRLET